jgi:hypothetical protein
MIKQLVELPLPVGSTISIEILQVCESDGPSMTLREKLTQFHISWKVIYFRGIQFSPLYPLQFQSNRPNGVLSRWNNFGLLARENEALRTRSLLANSLDQGNELGLAGGDSGAEFVDKFFEVDAVWRDDG